MLKRRENKYEVPQIAKDFIDNIGYNCNLSGSYKIYQFVDDTNNCVFYIGCTLGSIKKRFYGHIHSCVMHHELIKEWGGECGHEKLEKLKDFIDGKINISINILFEFDSKEKAFEVESMLIYLFSLNNNKTISLTNRKNSKTTNYKKS